MRAPHDSSVEELRRESERTRAALTRTLGELREKVSDTASDLKARITPEHLKDEVKGYVQEQGNNFLDALKRHARENPLEVVAIGTAVAYPLVKVARAVPMPVLLIGAGLWFAATQGKKVKDKVENLADAATQKAVDLATSVQMAASAGALKVSETASGAGKAVSSAVGIAADTTRAAVHDVRDAVAGAGAAVARPLGAAAGDVAPSAAGAVRTAARAGRRTGAAAGDLVHQHPAMAVGVGLAVGAALAAASLPRWGAHSDLPVKNGNGLKPRGKARDLARSSAPKAHHPRKAV